MKNYDKRDDNPHGARRVDKYGRTTVWLRSNRPGWMSEQEYADCPEQIEIRLVDVIIEQPGFRSKKYAVRAKTPAMVQTEMWSCLMAYNLIQMKMLQNCSANGRLPRTLSFTTT